MGRVTLNPSLLSDLAPPCSGQKHLEKQTIGDRLRSHSTIELESFPRATLNACFLQHPCKMPCSFVSLVHVAMASPLWHTASLHPRGPRCSCCRCSMPGSCFPCQPQGLVARWLFSSHARWVGAWLQCCQMTFYQFLQVASFIISFFVISEAGEHLPLFASEHL